MENTIRKESIFQPLKDANVNVRHLILELLTIGSIMYFMYDVEIWKTAVELLGWVSLRYLLKISEREIEVRHPEWSSLEEWTDFDWYGIK
jgi:hypothetical protein